MAVDLFDCILVCYLIIICKIKLITLDLQVVTKIYSSNKKYINIDNQYL